MARLWKNEPRLYYAIKRHFGNLPNALQAAGVSSRSQESWSRTRIISIIRHRAEHGPPLNKVWNDNKPLFSAATKKFGSWQAALAAAGVPFRKFEKWSKEKVITNLQSTYFGQSRFRETYPQLEEASRRFFGSFLRALEEAGLDPPPGRWSKKRIIDNIQEFYVQGRLLRINGCGDKRLADAAKRHFGSWREAVKAAGLESRLPIVADVKQWTRDLVIEEIQAIASRAGLSQAWREHPQLYEVAFRIFGTWNEALMAAGFKPTRRRWTNDAVLDAIRARHAAGLSLSSFIMKDDPPLAGAALRLFGSWRQALKASGISNDDCAVPKTLIARRKNTHVA
jgi:hypothetical protein